jgi:hypothetical protein
MVLTNSGECVGMTKIWNTYATVTHSRVLDSSLTAPTPLLRAPEIRG